MKKINIVLIYKTAIFITILAIAIVAMVPINKNYNVNPWMGELENETIITEMAIPGTHDSGAMHSIFDVAGKCQDLSIKEQLKVGIRFLDIRLQLVNDELVVVHSFVDQDLTFKSVLKDIDGFLNDYTSEFIIMSIKEDNASKNSKVEFDKKVIEELLKYERIKLDNSLPKTLGEARSNVYILNRFTSENVGIDAYSGWHDSTSFYLNDLFVQDNYCVDSFEEKKEDIIKAFELDSNNTLLLNFTSCYLDNAFLPSYAGTIAKDVNKWLDKYLEENNVFGIVIIDFATEKLVRDIYMENNYEKNN